jgi:hypothetical protein
MISPEIPSIESPVLKEIFPEFSFAIPVSILTEPEDDEDIEDIEISSPEVKSRVPLLICPYSDAILKEPPIKP